MLTLSDGSLKITEKKLYLLNCSPKDFSSESSIQEALRTISFERHFCFNFSSAEIEGALGTKKFEFITIDYIRGSNNSYSNKTCNSQEFIDHLLDNSNFTLNFLNSQIYNPEKYNNPVEKFTETPYIYYR